ncbi:MAG: hypothetical protein WDO68_18470 [Gammaproteobacteria bacterium]
MPDRLLAPASVATLLCLTTTAVTAQTTGTMNAEQGWSSIARCAQEDSERARHTCLDRVLRDAGLLTPEMHAQQQRREFGLEDKAVRAVPPAPAGAASTASTAAASSTGTGVSATSAKSPAASAEALNRRAAKTTTGGGATPPTATATPPVNASPSSANASPSSANPAPSPAAAAPAAPPDRLEAELAKVEKAANGNLFVTTTDGAVWLQAESVDMPQPPVAGDRMTIRKGSMGGYRCSVVSTHLTYRCVRSR